MKESTHKVTNASTIAHMASPRVKKVTHVQKRIIGMRQISRERRHGVSVGNVALGQAGLCQTKISGTLLDVQYPLAIPGTTFDARLSHDDSGNERSPLGLPPKN